MCVCSRSWIKVFSDKVCAVVLQPGQFGVCTERDERVRERRRRFGRRGSDEESTHVAEQ